MIFSSIGYYALILGLLLSIPIIFFSIKNFTNSNILDYKIINFSLLQFILVFISFLANFKSSLSSISTVS